MVTEETTVAPNPEQNDADGPVKAELHEELRLLLRNMQQRKEYIQAFRTFNEGIVGAVEIWKEIGLITPDMTVNNGPEDTDLEESETFPARLKLFFQRKWLRDNGFNGDVSTVAAALSELDASVEEFQTQIDNTASQYLTDLFGTPVPGKVSMPIYGLTAAGPLQVDIKTLTRLNYSEPGGVPTHEGTLVVASSDEVPVTCRFLSVGGVNYFVPESAPPAIVANDDKQG